MSLINIFYSFYFDYLDNITSYIGTLFLSLFAGLIFFTIGKKERETINIYEQLFLIVMILKPLAYLVFL